MKETVLLFKFCSWFCQLKKNAQPESWELFYSADFLRNSSPGHSISDNVEKTVPEKQGGQPEYIGIFATKDQVVGTSKGYCKLKKTRYLKLRNLVLFCVWEDTRVWAHWNHSFDMYVSCQGPVSCDFSSWVSSGCTVEDGCSSWLLDGLGNGQPVCLHPKLPQGSPSWWW